MSVAMTLAFRTDVNAPLVTHRPVTLMMQGDDRANVIELTMVDGDAQLNLDGYSAVLYLGRKDGVKVRCPGTVAGNVAKVTLQAECYSVPGPYAAVMKLTGPEEKRTVLRLAGYVESDGEGPIIDPSGTIPSYDDLERIMKELEDALQQAETAISGANAAAQNANEKAAIADTAAGNANTAAGNANAGAGRANEASESIEGLTVEASDVAYNKPATATVTDVEGHKHIAFGLRQGVPGPVPKLTFTGETGEPNTDVVITQSGPPEAPVVNLKIPQGVPGIGNVSSVDGVVSDTGGNVSLSSVRYVMQMLQPAQQQQARANIGIIADTYSGAGVHNAIYRGANLGTSATSDQWSAIQAGTFTDLYIGDYWRINGVNWRIAAFDYYYNTGDTLCLNHHIVLVPDTGLYSYAMNDTDTTNGGYIGSKMRTSGLAQALSIVQNAFGSEHILTHRNYFSNAVTSGAPSGQAWVDSQVDLMSEHNMFGGKLFEVGNTGINVPLVRTVDMSQFPLFMFRHDIIANKQTFWLRDIASSSQFSCLYDEGRATFDYAKAPYGVRPAFCIYSPAS